MFNYKDNTRLQPFEISADGGNTWTNQLMSYVEAANEIAMGRVIRRKVMQKCERCGALFYVEYCSNGTYEYLNDVCECESEFYPYFSNEPTISEFMLMCKVAVICRDKIGSIAVDKENRYERKDQNQY